MFADFLLMTKHFCFKILKCFDRTTPLPVLSGASVYLSGALPTCKATSHYRQVMANGAQRQDGGDGAVMKSSLKVAELPSHSDARQYGLCSSIATCTYLILMIIFS